MGMEASTIYSMLPVGDRKDGVVLYASVTNPDRARNFHDYQIEYLQVPILIFHAKDDNWRAIMIPKMYLVDSRIVHLFHLKQVVICCLDIQRK